jgi:hypothetical protein
MKTAAYREWIEIKGVSLWQEDQYELAKALFTI